MQLIILADHNENYILCNLCRRRRGFLVLWIHVLRLMMICIRQGIPGFRGICVHGRVIDLMIS